MHDTLAGYLDAAKRNSNLKSDRALASAIPVCQPVMSRWRNGVLPDDDHMVRLAEMAGADKTTALILLNIWRATSLPVAEIYRAMLPGAVECDVRISAKRIRERSRVTRDQGANEEQPPLFRRAADRVERSLVWLFGAAAALGAGGGGGAALPY